MKRYLITYSYIGTHFRSIQKELRNGAVTDPDSIQGILELALQRFNPANEPTVVVSSRTDQGVHALSTSAHVDLEKSGHIKDYVPQWLMHGMNKTLEKQKVDIRIKKVQIVPDVFHARFSARSRTYLYRLAVRKESCGLPADGNLGHGSPNPMLEWRRCYFIQRSNFDVSRIHEITKYFEGTHDFKTFMGRHTSQPDKETVRTILKLEFRQGRPLINAEHDSAVDLYDYWEVICHGRSFLYRQVRRIVGVLIALAQGKIEASDVRRMIDEPGQKSWREEASVVPAYGLYLLNVEYDPESLVIPETPTQPETPIVPETSEVLETTEDADSFYLSQAQLESRLKNLRRAQTRVTLSSGDVYVETRTAEGHTTLHQVIAETSTGFVVDDKPDLQVGHVLPGLLVGSQDVACDINLLSTLSVTHILSIGVSVKPPIPSISHKFIDLLDLPESDCLDAFEESGDFINSVITSEPSGTVLVHCNAGVSRSPSAVIAYLIKYNNMNFTEAFDLVKNCRPSIKPNDGFVKYLQNYANYLKQ